MAVYPWIQESLSSCHGGCVIADVIGDAPRPQRAPSGNSSSPVSNPCSGSAPSWLHQYAPKFLQQAQTHKHTITLQ